MTSLSRVLALFVVVGGAAATGIACAEDNGGALENAPAPDSTILDSSRNETGETGTLPDAEPVDAGAETDGDVQPSTCSLDGWCHTELPDQTELSSVWSDGHGVAWAASSKRGPARILRWDGNAWTVAFEVPRVNQVDGVVWGSGPTDLWSFLDGIMYHGVGSTPASLAWSPVAVVAGAPMTNIRSIDGSGPADVWAVGSSGAWHLTAADSGFAADSVGGLATNFTRVRVSNGEVWLAIEVAPDWGRLVRGRATDAGMSWKELTRRFDNGNSSDQIADLLLSDSGTVWVTGYRPINTSYIRHGTIVGDTIELDNPGFVLGNATTALWGDGSKFYSAGRGVGAIGSFDTESWTIERITISTLPLPGPFLSISGSNSKDVWAVGGRLALHKTSGVTP